MVEVALNGVLQCGSSGSEFDNALRITSVEGSVDQTAAEGVAAAYAVNDVQVVALGEAILVRRSVVQHSCPDVVVCGDGGTQGDSDLLEAETLGELTGNALVCLVIQLAGVNVGILGAFLFGGCYIVAFVIANITSTQKELIKMLPYVITIVVLIITSIRKSCENQPPASLGLPYFREDR